MCVAVMIINNGNVVVVMLMASWLLIYCQFKSIACGETGIDDK